MYSDNKQIRDVADVAAKIMYGQQPVTEKLHPNQQQLDVHEPEKDKLTAKDFEMLRAGKKKVKENLEDFSLEEIEAKLTFADDEKITLEWQVREPKKIGKGKETVQKREEIPYSEI